MSTKLNEVNALEIMKKAMDKTSEVVVPTEDILPEIGEEVSFGQLLEHPEDFDAPVIEGTRSEQLLEEILSQLKGVNQHLKQLRNIALSIPMTMEEID